MPQGSSSGDDENVAGIIEYDDDDDDDDESVEECDHRCKKQQFCDILCKVVLNLFSCLL